MGVHPLAPPGYVPGVPPYWKKCGVRAPVVPRSMSAGVQLASAARQRINPTPLLHTPLVQRSVSGADHHPSSVNKNLCMRVPLSSWKQ